MVVSINKSAKVAKPVAVVIDNAYFAREAAKLKKVVATSKEHAQELTILAMAHAETHGDWTGSLLPIMAVILNTSKDIPGVFGPQLGKYFAEYISTYTKLVYNPKGLNGRKLSKLTIAERWGWDRTKTFDVEAAKTVKWWTLKPASATPEDKDYADDAVWNAKVETIVKGIQKLVKDGDIPAHKWEAYKAALVAELNMVKLPTIVAKVVPIVADTRESDDGVNHDQEETEIKVA